MLTLQDAGETMINEFIDNISTHIIIHLLEIQMDSMYCWRVAASLQNEKISKKGGRK